MANDKDTARIFVALWKLAEDAGIFVHYSGTLGALRGETGFFEPRTKATGGPWIGIIRPGFENGPTPLPESAELLAFLVTLAHEWGHAISWKAGHRTREYIAANRRFGRGEPLADEQRRLVLEEERRAWRSARTELLSLRFDRGDAFDKHEREAVEFYEAKTRPG
jgi:hypothetical protein